jgi:hypothetical protein
MIDMIDSEKINKTKKRIKVKIILMIKKIRVPYILLLKKRDKIIYK